MCVKCIYKILKNDDIQNCVNGIGSFQNEDSRESRTNVRCRPYDTAIHELYQLTSLFVGRLQNKVGEEKMFHAKE